MERFLEAWQASTQACPTTVISSLVIGGSGASVGALSLALPITAMEMEIFFSDSRRSSDCPPVEKCQFVAVSGMAHEDAVGTCGPLATCPPL